MGSKLDAAEWRPDCSTANAQEKNTVRTSIETLKFQVNPEPASRLFGRQGSNEDGMLVSIIDWTQYASVYLELVDIHIAMITPSQAEHP